MIFLKLGVEIREKKDRKSVIVVWKSGIYNKILYFTVNMSLLWSN